jgi:tripartite-type tricarboxylate transporter receptor subunit TctC
VTITRRSLLAASVALPAVAHAQGTYPTRPIRLIVPYPPGAVSI